MYCFRDIFNSEVSCMFKEIDLKTFQDVWDPQNGSLIWVLPGHILYTNCDRSKLLSCDARPLDAPNITKSEIAVLPSPLIDTFTVNNDQSSILYIVLSNGEVRYYEYNIMSYRWESKGHFNLVAKSVDGIKGNSRSIYYIHFHQDVFYWCEKDYSAPKESSFSLYKIKIPSISASELSNGSFEPGVLIMNNCPELKLSPLWGGLLIWPNLPHSIHVYLVWNSSQLALFGINGKCLWRTTTKSNQPVDFLDIMVKNVGLWSVAKSCVKLCVTLSTDIENLFILVGSTIMSLAATGEIDKKTNLSSTLENVCECYVHRQLVYVVTDSSLNLFSLNDGKSLQVIEFSKYATIRGKWYNSYFLPMFGFYTDDTVYQLHLRPLNEIFSSETSYDEILCCFAQGHLHFLALLKDLVCGHASNISKMPLYQIPHNLQSKALMLAVIQFCREKNIASHNFPFTEKCLNQILSSDATTDTYNETKLKRLLQPLVDCFIRIEEGKMKVISGNLTKEGHQE